MHFYILLYNTLHHASAALPRIKIVHSRVDLPLNELRRQHCRFWVLRRGVRRDHGALEEGGALVLQPRVEHLEAVVRDVVPEGVRDVLLDLQLER